MYVGKFLEAIKVHDCEFTKIRVGNKHDGGYIALKEVCEKAPVVYSAGIGDDVGFETDWISRFPNTKFKMYDPLIDELPSEHKNFEFIKYGLGSSYAPLRDIEEGAALKMDIEYDEWGALSKFDPEEIEKVSQIFIEFHVIHACIPNNLSPYFTGVYDDAMERINDTIFHTYYQTMRWLLNYFIIFHIHANNSLPIVCVDGYFFPPLLEMSLVRRNLVKEAKPTRQDFPVEGLDFPNKPNRPDIYDYYPWGSNGSVR